MQSKQNLVIDARTFPQIWQGLTQSQQSELRYQLTHNADCSRQSVHNWSKGITPISLAMRRKVAATLGKTLGLNVSHITLFPSR